MSELPQYSFIIPWQQGRCVIQLLDREIPVNHVYVQHRKLPYFHGRVGTKNFETAEFTTLLRQMAKFIISPPRPRYRRRPS